MTRVIVYVKREDEVKGRDLEVSAEISMDELSSLIARALHWEDHPSEQTFDYTVYATPLNRRLDPRETLAQADVWDGSTLVLSVIEKRDRNGEAKQSTVIPQALLESESSKRYYLTGHRFILGRHSFTAQSEDRAELIDFSAEPHGRTISRRHALLEYEDGEWWITPIHQKQNQTILDGKKLHTGQRYKLKEGARLQLGQVRILFQTNLA